MRAITQSELQQADGIQSASVWIAYKGLVYDVSSSPLFCDGIHFDHPCGTDLSDEMILAPHLDEVLETFQVVGFFDKQ